MVVLIKLSLRLLGATISSNFTVLHKKAQRQLFFLRHLHGFGPGQDTIIRFYHAIIESILIF